MRERHVSYSVSSIHAILPCAHTLLSVSTTALPHTTINNTKPLIIQGRAYSSPVRIEAMQESAVFAAGKSENTTGFWVLSLEAGRLPVHAAREPKRDAVI